MNDIGNDDFVQILHIHEPTDSDSESSDQSESETAPIIHRGSLKVPEIRMTGSENSISYVLDGADENRAESSRNNDEGIVFRAPWERTSSLSISPRKGSNASEISISSILDLDIPEVESSALTVPVMTPSSSDVSISHILDHA